MIKAAIFDIDNTLYSHYTNSIPSLTMRALLQLKKQGVIICLNTSRDRIEITSEINTLLSIADCLCTGSGGMMIVNNEIVCRHFIDENIISKVIDLLESYPDISYRYTVDSGKYYFSLNSGPEQMAFSEHWTKKKAIKKKISIDDKIMSILVFDFTDELKNNVDELDVTTFVWGSMMDILPNDVSKATSVNDFMNYYHLQKGEVIAFGDGGNDVTMLQLAGIGVATNQASEECKRAADSIGEETIDNGGIYFSLIEHNVIKSEFKLFVFDADSLDFNLPSTISTFTKLCKNNIKTILIGKINEEYNYFFDYIINPNRINYSLNFELSNIIHNLNIKMENVCIVLNDENNIELTTNNAFHACFEGSNINIQRNSDFICDKLENDGLFKILKKLESK